MVWMFDFKIKKKNRAKIIGPEGILKVWQEYCILLTKDLKILIPA